jgi:hypothetical protein
MKPILKPEPKYRVTMLTREEWTRGPGTPLADPSVNHTSPLRARLVQGWIQDSGGYRDWGSMGNLWEEGSTSL